MICIYHGHRIMVTSIFTPQPLNLNLKAVQVLFLSMASAGQERPILQPESIS